MTQIVLPSTHHVILLASTAVTGDTAAAGDAVLSLDKYSRAVLLLTVSGKSVDGGDTLDIYVQYSPDFGTTWDDIAHFAQMTSAAVGDGTYVMVLNHGTAGIADRATDDGATLAAASVRNQPWGDRMRIKYDGANLSGGDTVTIKVEAWFYA
jgi:hypothetical protein